MMRRGVDELIAAAHDLGWGDQRAVDLLASCLTMGGLAMGVAGRTAPSSGSEHLMSHLLEMRGDAFGLSTASHGSQVGVASVFAGIVWQDVRERITRDGCRADASNIADFARVRAAFAPLDASGAMAEECWTNYQRKSRWIQLHLDDINEVLNEWTTHDVNIEALLEPPEFVAALLRSAQAPSTFDELDPPPAPEAVVWAIANCHLMRDRFTVVDLADLLGVWDISNVKRLLSRQRAMAK
jgi:glycerol-1-phosphate dehydrogenase [NAD(P)+]